MAKPNILHIFTDMQRADTIHALGNPVIKTPNLDRLVREGTAFTNCYTPSPVCVSARCCMHYGLYPTKTGLPRNGMMPDHNGRAYPDLLRKAGYTSRAIGKCHFTPDKFAMRGFDSRRVQEEMSADGKGDHYREFLRDNGYDASEAFGSRGEMYYIPQVSHLPQEVHPTQWIGDQTIDFMTEQKDPWCVFSSFIHPHPPLCPPRPWHKLYRAPLMPLPRVPQDSERLHTSINRRQNRYKYRDQGIDNNLMRNIKAHYYAMISFIDFQVGRMLDALEEAGTLDNTLILFTSDHGEYLGDYNCFGKRSMHNPSSRVPMLVRYPKRFKAGQICDEVTSLVDVVPTFLRAAGIRTKKNEFDGEDLRDVAKGKMSRDFVYSQFHKGPEAIYMICTREWKYFYSAPDNQEYLFDRITDPDETRNKAGLSLCDEPRLELKKRLIEFLKENGIEDAYTQDDDWRVYPPTCAPGRGLVPLQNDPDEFLLIQDEPLVPIPGYSD